MHVPMAQDYPHAVRAFFDPFQVFHILEEKFRYKVTKEGLANERSSKEPRNLVVTLEHPSRPGGRFPVYGSNLVSFTPTDCPLLG